MPSSKLATMMPSLISSTTAFLICVLLSFIVAQSSEAADTLAHLVGIRETSTKTNTAKILSTEQKDASSSTTTRRSLINDDCSLAVCPVCAQGEMRLLPDNGGCCPICVKPDCTVCKTGYFDGCNSCTCGSPVGVCTLAFCSEDRADPSCVDGLMHDSEDDEQVGEDTGGSTSYSNPITVDCSTCLSGEFFDGCNDCFCADNGLTACTEKFCETTTDPYCKGVEDGSEDVSIGDVYVGVDSSEPENDTTGGVNERPIPEQEDSSSSSSSGRLPTLFVGISLLALQYVL